MKEKQKEKTYRKKKFSERQKFFCGTNLSLSEEKKLENLKKLLQRVL